MRPPRRDDPPPSGDGRGAQDGVVYVERSSESKGTWEDRQRPRSTTNSPQLLLGAFSLFVFWLSVAGLITCLVMVTLGHAEPWTELCLWAGGLLVVSLVSSLLISLNVRCPLCHGSPLHSRHGCHKHRLADHWFPLTHRATVVLRILVTLSFRCMYCGTPFRLFKKSSRQRP